MLLKLGSDFTVLLLLCSDEDVAVDTDESKDDAGSFIESDDKDDGLISELVVLEEWSDWEICRDESVLNNGFLSKKQKETFVALYGFKSAAVLIQV